jgi:hypothetical protein
MKGRGKQSAQGSSRCSGDNGMGNSVGVGQFGVQTAFWGDMRCASHMGLVWAFDAWQIGLGSIKATGLEGVLVNSGERCQVA